MPGGIHRMLEGVIDVLINILFVMVLLLLIAGVGLLIVIGFAVLTKI